MTRIQRICPQCGGSTSIDARYCSTCGYDHHGDLPVHRNALPVAVGKAAVPVLVGAATLALRFGWKLLSSRLTTPSPLPVQTPTVSQPKPMAPRTSGRRVHIRSSWAIGDANGVWRQGTSEHIIDFDD